LTEHDDVIKTLLRGTPRLGLALGPAPARVSPELTALQITQDIDNMSPTFFK